MSIKIVPTSVFESGADTIVNTVNCVGFMGAGLALEFSLRYPKMLKSYQNKIKKDEIRIGKLDYYKDGEVSIINFPTKTDYKTSSNIKYIEEGLDNFIETYEANNIKSVAFPKLGSGLGGLNWNTVKELMISKLNGLPIDIFICEDVSHPTGIEAEMLSFAKDYNLLNLNLRSNLYRPLEKNIKNANRFYEIKSEGTGIETYKKIHEAAYSFANKKSYPNEHKNYSISDQEEIYNILVNTKWNEKLKVTYKQGEDINSYLKQIKHDFSFYEFLGASKRYIEILREKVLSEFNNENPFKLISMFD